jgi:hypothetical protein
MGGDIKVSGARPRRRIHRHRRMIESGAELQRPVVPRPPAVGGPEDRQTAARDGRKHRAAVREDHGPGVEAILEREVVPRPRPAAVKGGESSADQLFVRRALRLAGISEIRHQGDAADEVTGIPGIGGQVGLHRREPRAGSGLDGQVRLHPDRTGTGLLARAAGGGPPRHHRHQRQNDNGSTDHLITLLIQKWTLAGPEPE